MQLLDLGKREPERAHLGDSAHAPERGLIEQAVVGLAATSAVDESAAVQLADGLVLQAGSPASSPTVINASSRPSLTVSAPEHVACCETIHARG